MKAEYKKKHATGQKLSSEESDAENSFLGAVAGYVLHNTDTGLAGVIEVVNLDGSLKVAERLE
jgi:hypothetical protein